MSVTAQSSPDVTITKGSVDIGENKLFYITNANKYIISFVDESLQDNLDINKTINIVYDTIIPCYNNYDRMRLVYGNTCDANSQELCNKLKGYLGDRVQTGNLGRIIIYDYPVIDESVKTQIATIYGTREYWSPGSTHHVLAYLEIIISGITFYVAIETTSSNPYKLQFYVATTKEDLIKIINIRYPNEELKISNELGDCNKPWNVIMFPTSSGGKKQKTKTKGKKQPKPKKSRKTKKSKKSRKNRKSRKN
jgi:hypothetical protein